MSLYAEYVMEGLGYQIVETEKGFATFKIQDDNSCYIVDIYVSPAFRKQGVSRDIVDSVVTIAKKNGCTKLLGSVIPSYAGSTVSLQMMLAHGMTLDSSTNNYILFRKTI